MRSDDSLPTPSPPLLHTYLSEGLPKLQTTHDLDPETIRSEKIERIRELLAGHERRCRRLRTEYMILANMLFEYDLARDDSDDEDEFSSQSHFEDIDEKEAQSQSSSVIIQGKRDGISSNHVSSCASFQDGSAVDEEHQGATDNESEDLSSRHTHRRRESTFKPAWVESKGSKMNPDYTVTGKTKDNYSHQNNRYSPSVVRRSRPSNASSATSSAFSCSTNSTTSTMLTSLYADSDHSSLPQCSGSGSIFDSSKPHYKQRRDCSLSSTSHSSNTNVGDSPQSFWSGSSRQIPFTPYQPTPPPPFAPFSTFFEAPLSAEERKREEMLHDPWRRDLLDAVFDKKEKLRVGYVMMQRVEEELAAVQRKE